MDGRRHSTDIPISKTLVALRRVRSLRDPSTNSLGRFSALADNLNWETNSCDGISLQLVNGCDDARLDKGGFLGSKNVGIYGMRQEDVDNCEVYDSSEKLDSLPMTKSTTLRAQQADESHVGRYLAAHRANGRGLEDVGAYGKPNVGPLGPVKEDRVDQTLSNQKSHYENQRKSSAAMHDVMSCVGSPCLSRNGDLLESSQGNSLYASEGVDVVDFENHGCGKSCCWVRTPRFTGPSSPETDDHPLLSRETCGTIWSGQRKNRRHIHNELIPYTESPRNLGQKFRLKSFDDLVGQNVVSQSLLRAISKGKVASFYLFYGPRGTGKTSASRIFAAALNCLALDDHKPCGICQDCVTFFSGRSRDIKEIDSVRINRSDRIRSLIKCALAPPVSSRFKVFLIDECQMLRGETWATVLNSLENLSQHVVFVMITSDLDKLPRGAVSRSQRYHFPKIKDVDISCRLERICVEDGLDFDRVALEFISARSNGSIREAEMMLDQLSLLGKRITLSLAHELIGVVPEDELIDLLDLALSSDTSNTVRRAREMMRSRIDPMQLTSHLANLIMDVLAGKCEHGASEVRRKFFERHTSESDLHKLSHALKILSETEKQLRTSKNQTTWLTVALLQLSSVEPSVLDANDPKFLPSSANQREGEFCSTSSTGSSMKQVGSCRRENGKFHKMNAQEDFTQALEAIWSRATELCQSRSLRKLLRKEGKLSLVCVHQGSAVAELEFCNSESVSRAEKSWKLIASSLQSVLGCNVEIRINLASGSNASKNIKVKKKSFSLFSCSRRIQREIQASTEHGSGHSDCTDLTSQRAIVKEKPNETCLSDCSSQFSHVCCHRTEAAQTIRNNEGNALSTGIVATSCRSNHPIFESDSLKEEGCSHGCQVVTIQQSEEQPNCFSRTFRHHKRPSCTGSSQMICLRLPPQDMLALSASRKEVFPTCCCDTDPYIFCSSSNNFSNNFRNENV
ncbi:hypothetical protein RJ641_014274 [Dillenia turbinata]|uniref:DNA-directed DNA polymerase n=1 Tax=Dillenia turbinata TaxID=194707 RepID=A0AAN8Z136_9MAGN